MFEIFGVPAPQKRARFHRIGKFVSTYDPQRVDKKKIQWQLRSLYREEPIKTPVIVEVLFGLPIPQKTSKVKTRQMLQGDIVPMKKPDIDNLLKFILDCLTGILFDDDSQIIEVKAKKFYSETPRTVIRTTCLNNIHDEMRDLNMETSPKSM